jgi:radical SAM/SPASM domain protein of ACGX system
MKKEIIELKYQKFFPLQWHVTNKCGQHCRHCYIYGKDGSVDIKSEPSRNDVRKVIDDLVFFSQAINCRPGLVITGGDPLLYPHLWYLLGYARKKKIGFSMLGNPFLLTPEICRRLFRLGCTRYQLSLDGLEKTHDELRQRGSFRATLRALPMIRRAGMTVSIMSTVSKMNYKEIPALIKLLADKKIYSYDFARYSPTHSDTEYNIEPAEYRKFLARIWGTYKKYKNKGVRFHLKDHLWKPFLLEEGLAKFPKKRAKKAVDGCHCGMTYLTLLPDGAVYACRRFDSPVGRSPDEPFYYIWHNVKINRYREVEKIEGCKDCELLYYCRGCPAVSYGTTGSFFSGDPQCWRIKR